MYDSNKASYSEANISYRCWEYVIVLNCPSILVVTGPILKLEHRLLFPNWIVLQNKGGKVLLSRFSEIGPIYSYGFVSEIPNQLYHPAQWVLSAV